MLFKDLPQTVDANYTSRGDKIDLELELADFNYADRSDYIIFREEGIIGPEVTAFIEGIPAGLDLELNADLVLNATVDNLTLTGDIQFKTDQPVGPIYLVIDQKEDENPYHLEALIPRLPSDMNLTLDIRESNFGVDISSNQPIDFLALDLQLGETEGLVTNWVEGVSLNMSDDGGMDAKVYITGISPKVSLNLLDVEGVGTTVDVVLEDFNNDSPAMSSILVDVTNFANRSVLLRIDDLPEEVDVNASIFLSDLEDSEGPIVGNVSLLTNKQLGSLFASIADEESETNLELSIPEVPERVDLDIELGDDIYANFSSSSAPSRIILGIESNYACLLGFILSKAPAFTNPSN